MPLYKDSDILARKRQGLSPFVMLIKKKENRDNHGQDVEKFNKMSVGADRESKTDPPKEHILLKT